MLHHRIIMTVINTSTEIINIVLLPLGCPGKLHNMSVSMNQYTISRQGEM